MSDPANPDSPIDPGPYDKVPRWKPEDEVNLRERVKSIHPASGVTINRFDQGFRDVLLRSVAAREYRKTARIVALQIEAPFTVETDRGVMAGQAGDWLATNHPDDDPGSDLWAISDERMRATYAPVQPAFEPAEDA